MSVCVSCNYDNPYTDARPYTCRQCIMRAEAWGSPVVATTAVQPVPTPTAGRRKPKVGDNLRIVSEGLHSSRYLKVGEIVKVVAVGRDYYDQLRINFNSDEDGWACGGSDFLGKYFEFEDGGKLESWWT